MSTPFTQRVFGCAIIKSVNSNYNADFNHQPRTLPDGTIYATDKALKYSIRNYWVKNFPDQKILYFKRLNENLNPYDLDEAYQKMFPEDKSGKDKKIALANLLTCLDVKFFGATYANKKKKLALSIHGPVQISHGVDRYGLGHIFSEQIMSPFRDDKSKQEGATSSQDKEEDIAEKEASTLGSQSKLSEGHYVHHFSINPQNIEGYTKLYGGIGLTDSDIDLLKKALRNGCSYYDSAAKIGTENELLLWIELKHNSSLVLPSFVEKVSIGEDRVVDLSEVTAIVERPTVAAQIEKIEIFCDPSSKLKGIPTIAQRFEINQ